MYICAYKNDCKKTGAESAVFIRQLTDTVVYTAVVVLAFFLVYDNMEPNKSTNCIFMRCCLSGLKCQYSKYTSIFGGYKR